MRTTAFLFLLLAGLPAGEAFAQKNITVTNAFRISGEVKAERTVTLDDLKKMKSDSLGDLPVSNHAGEVKGTMRHVKGVPLKTLLALTEFKSESPKQLSTFYFVCMASDGYKVVFSWNELMNNPLGDSVYILTEKNGQTLDTMDDHIALFVTSDLRTGRRFVKGLSAIEVFSVK